MTTSPFKFLDSYTREDIGYFFGNGTLMTLIFMMLADEFILDLLMQLGLEAMSDLRKSAFIRVICVPS